MIRYRSHKQLSLEEFDWPFQTKLDKTNRWVKLSAVIPWDELAEGYYQGLSDTQGRPAKDARLVIGAVIVKHKQCASDRETVEQIKENPYLRVPRSWQVLASVTVLKMGDEASRSQPAGAGFKPPHAAAFKRRGGERWGKGGARRRQVGPEKTSENEPLMTHRNGLQTLSKRVEVGSTLRSMDDTSLRSMRQPVYRWRDLRTGFGTERGNLAWGGKENPQVAHTTRENTDTHDRGGAARSSDEATVMVVERRGCVTQSDHKRQPVLPGGAP